MTTIRWISQVSETCCKEHFNQDPDELFIWYELIKTYFFDDAVHIPNNSLVYFSFITVWWFQRSHQRSRWREKTKVFSWRSRKRCCFRNQLEKSSKANNEGNTPRKLQRKRSDSTCNISWTNCCCYSILFSIQK